MLDFNQRGKGVFNTAFYVFFAFGNLQFQSIFFRFRQRSFRCRRQQHTTTELQILRTGVAPYKAIS